MNSFRLPFILTICQLLLGSSILHSQMLNIVEDNYHIIEYDFAQHEFIELDRHRADVKKHDWIKIKVTNINMNLFNVGTTLDDTVESQMIVDQIAPIFDKISSSLISLAPLGGIVIPQMKAQPVSDSPENMDVKEMSQSNVNEMSGLVDKIEHVIQPNKKKNKELKQENEKLRKKLDEISKSQNEEQLAHKRSIVSTYNYASNQANNYALGILEFKEKLLEQSNNMRDYFLDYELMDNLNSDKALSKKRFEKILSAIKSVQDQIFESNKKLLNSQHRFKSEHDNLVVNITDEKFAGAINKNATLLFTVYSEINKSYEGLLSIFSDTVLLNLINQYTVLQNSTANEFICAPIKYTENLKSISFDIKPKKENSGLQLYTIMLPLPLKKETTKIGISTSFYLGTLASEAFSITSDSLEGFGFLDEKPGKLEFGITTLFNHINLNEDNDFGYHLCIGPGIAYTDKVRLRMFCGGGLSFGEKRNMLLSMMISVGQKEQLSSLYSKDEKYDVAPANYMVSKTNVGLNISFGYLINTF